jgi:tetratricopeptide (TPR) repeat protein
MARGAVFAGIMLAVHGVAADTNAAAVLKLRDRAQEVLFTAQKAYEAQPTNSVMAWQFARAAFDRAEFATNDTERAGLAVQGIGTCRKAIAADPKSAPAHYYLGMNLGQLARTKLLGALPLVDEMESSFKTARQLDEQFDYAGPDRNLGQLYFQAPGWPASVGSQSKARKHLERAVELDPGYPENRLNLAFGHLKWRDKKPLQRELESIEKLWPVAKTNFTGAEWDAAWLDWQQRYDQLREKAALYLTH